MVNHPEVTIFLKNEESLKKIVVLVNKSYPDTVGRGGYLFDSGTMITILLGM